MRRRELLWRASGAAEPCLERAELLRQQLKLARQRAHLRLDRVDSGGEPGGIADALACIAGGAFLWQRHVRPRLHQRFERGDHGPKIGDLLLEAADSVGRGRSGCRRRLPFRRRSLLRYRLRRHVLLGEHRFCRQNGQK